MKAVRIHQFGAPEVMAYEEVPDPVAGPNEVVVAVQASGVNPADYKFRNGSLNARSPRPLALPLTLGMDVVGTIAAVGPGAERFAVGDPVLAMLYLMGNGGYAEQVAVPVDWCGPLPAELDPIRAATLPTPGTTALEWIEDGLRIEAGQRLLVLGAAGAVGRIAAFVARARGAHVTAGIRRGQEAQVEYADDVLLLDGAAPAPGRFDAIADAIGGETAVRMLSALKPGAPLSTIATDLVEPLAPAGAVVRRFGCHADGARLSGLAEAAADGRLTIAPPTVLPMSAAAEAHRRMERGGAGKIVLVPDRLYVG